MKNHRYKTLLQQAMLSSLQFYEKEILLTTSIESKNLLKNAEDFTRLVINGNYTFCTVLKFEKERNYYSSWSLCDRIVIKALSIFIIATTKNKLSKQCLHIQGHGGLPKAMREIEVSKSEYNYCYKTDVHSYYTSINHRRLLTFFVKEFGHGWLTKIIWSLLRHKEYKDSVYKTVKQGICRGSAMSPIFSAIYLLELDKYYENTEDVKYLRYQDDILVLTKTLEQAEEIKQNIQEIIKKHKLKLRPEKTEFGPTKSKFSFLGFTFKSNKIVSLAKKTKQKFCLKYKKKLNLNYFKIEQNDSAEDYLKYYCAWIKGVAKNYITLLIGLVKTTARNIVKLTDSLEQLEYKISKNRECTQAFN